MHKSLLSKLGLGLAAVMWLAGCAPAFSEDEEQGPEAAPDIGSVERAFTHLPESGSSLISRARSAYLIVCLHGTMVNDGNRGTLETDIRNAIMTWITGAAGDATGSLVSSDRVVFSCTIPDVTVNWDASSGNTNCVAGTPGCTRAHFDRIQRSVNMFGGYGYDVLLHEFGHAFGLDDTYVDATNNCREGQPSSVMCQDSAYTTLQNDDVNAVREAYCIAFPNDCRRRWSSAMNWCALPTQQMHVGDFNGDGRTDMLCHDTSSGMKWISLAAGGGSFSGTTFTITTPWCNHPEARLHVGKFNADARSDLLCHDVANGTKWVWLAASNGSFTGSSWQGNLNWCAIPTQQLHLGDFNGDGRTDMLCHDTSSGTKWISLAAAGGTFSGTTFTVTTPWCNHANGRLHVGKFNADARSDLLCHDVANGTKWVWLASSTGTFTGSSWQGDLNWCVGSALRLTTGDFNGDTRTDMLCHALDTGHKWIAFASSTGTFTGTSRSWPMNWCNHPGAQFMVGNFNGDSADDFLCHDTTSGTKWIAFQRP